MTLRPSWPQERFCLCSEPDWCARGVISSLTIEGQKDWLARRDAYAFWRLEPADYARWVNEKRAA